MAPAFVFLCLAAFPAEPAAETCPSAGRPDLSAAIDSLVADIVARTPEFKHIDPARVLFIAADARHASRATTRPTRFPDGGTTSADGKWNRPVTVWNGKEIAYIIELRPKFFRRSTVEARVKTLFHELYHMSPTFDGTIPDGLSHKRTPNNGFDAPISPLIKKYLAQTDTALLKPLTLDGEVIVRQWLERPPNKFPADKKDARRRYGHADVFTGPVEMLTTDSKLKRALAAAGKGKLKAPVELNGDD